MGYEMVHGGFSFEDQNEIDKSILDFVITFDLIVATNTCYIKEGGYLITFQSEANRIQIDYFLVRNTDHILCIDCKVIPGERVATQYRLLALDVCIKRWHSIRKEPTNSWTRWQNFKDEKLKEFKEKIILEAQWVLDGENRRHVKYNGKEDQMNSE